MERDQFVVVFKVNNHTGVLMRIASLFARRAFNIESITAGTTRDPDFTRITIVAQGDEYVQEQVVKQLRKLEDVRTVQLLRTGQAVMRELMIIKVKLEPGKLSELVEAANTYRGNVIDLSPDSILIEVTGESGKLNAALEYFKAHGIIEMSRTGPTAMGRSTYCLENN